MHQSQQGKRAHTISPNRMPRERAAVPEFESIHRLAVYGSLTPGGSNHAVLTDISGQWRRGWVEGDLHAEGWGATQGYPGLRWKPGAAQVGVYLFESRRLTEHWRRLDAFEGDGYRRIVVPVHGVEGETDALEANIYVVRDNGHPLQ
jgi:gamma-glutamylcyclotransferase (GGCT)/AIG2-like uncharacterized protein YtfP